MERLEVSYAVRPIYGSLGAKGLTSLVGCPVTLLPQGHIGTVYNSNSVLFSSFTIISIHRE
jgi:hypothetical protein